jgi:hypothetical protein
MVAALICVAAAGCGEKMVEAPPAKVTFESGSFRILDATEPAGTTLAHTYENDMAAIVKTARRHRASNSSISPGSGCSCPRGNRITSSGWALIPSTLSKSNCAEGC